MNFFLLQKENRNRTREEKKTLLFKKRYPFRLLLSTVNWRLCWGLNSQSPIFVTKFPTVKWVNSFFKTQIVFLHLKVKTFSQNRAVILNRLLSVLLLSFTAFFF